MKTNPLPLPAPHPFEYLSDRFSQNRRRQYLAHYLIREASTPDERADHVDRYLGKWARPQFLADLHWMRVRFVNFPPDLLPLLDTNEGWQAS